MKLEKHERDGPLWKRLQTHFSERLQILREQNDGRNNNADDTAFLRGRIAELKECLDMASGPPPVVETKKFE